MLTYLRYALATFCFAASVGTRGCCPKFFIAVDPSMHDASCHGL